MGSFGAMGSCRGGCRVAWFSGPVIRRLLILMRGMRGRGILLLLRRMLHRVVRERAILVLFIRVRRRLGT
jgi:hypothetical protein